MPLKEFDIFAKVGRGVAYDEVIPFTVKDGKLKIADEISDFEGILAIKLKKVGILSLLYDYGCFVA